MFFQDWDNLVRTLAVGATGYAGLVLLLRISGNRTLSKINSFDLVVTVAFGSLLASLMVTNSISLTQGLTAIALLIVLQYVITWLSVRSDFISKVIKTQPTLLLLDGEMLQDAMRRVRVNEDEVRGALRQQGLGSLDQAAAVVLDTDGSLSVISMAQRGNLGTLQGVSVWRITESRSAVPMSAAIRCTRLQASQDMARHSKAKQRKHACLDYIPCNTAK